MDPFKAGQVLGQAVFGDQQGAYDEQLGTEYKNQRALQDARRAQSLALIDADRLSARQAVTPEAMQTLGYSEPASQFLPNILRANTTLDLDQLGKFQRPGYDVMADRATQAVLGDDFPTYNASNAFMEGKTYEPTRVLGGAYVPSGVEVGSEDFVAVPTPEAAERIDATQRKTAAYESKQARGPAPKAPKPDKPPSASQQESAVLQQARAAIAAGASVESVKQRLKDRGYGKLAGRL